jgi:hypothetical protein
VKSALDTGKVLQHLACCAGVFFVKETEHFINTGYGWTCKRCAGREDAARGGLEGARARFLREGEAEERDPQLSTPALARWRDETRQTLVCPRCGIEEAL